MPFMFVGSQPAETEKASNVCVLLGQIEDEVKISLHSSQANRMAGNDWGYGHLQLAEKVDKNNKRVNKNADMLFSSSFEV